MRVGVDGYNLAIPNGTGVATYGFSLAKAVANMGHVPEAVFGIDPGPELAIQETLFFERFGCGDRRGQLRRRVRNAFLQQPFGVRHLRPIALTDYVDKRDFASRWPDFQSLWTSPLLFELATARFAALRRFTTVAMPNPPAVMHWTYPVPLRMVGSRNFYTLHDLVPLKLPHTTLDNKTQYYRLIELILRAGDHILTVSESSRRDILDMFDVDPGFVTNTYQSSPLPQAVAQSTEAEDHATIAGLFGLPPRGFYLLFGATDPKKNIGRMIDAYLASQSERPLVVVSSRDWGMAGATGGLGKDGSVYGRSRDRSIIQLQYLPRETLFRLIRSARAVLFASIYEGFGLPALEAIQLGTPVISSTTSSLPEVVGEGGLLVDPYNIAAITGAICAIDGDDTLMARLSAAGLAHAGRFTENAFIERLHEVYSRAELIKR